jgi:hypothetical protein
LFEVAGKVNVPPLQIGATCVKVGVTGVFTITVIEAVVAHCPVLGVKVYEVVDVLLIGVVHDPVIPLFEVAGKVNVPPLQIGATCVKVGVTGVFTVTVIEAVVAHCPASGVKVYAVVAVLLIGVVHVPVKFSFDVDGKVNVPPLQIGATCVKVGVTGAPTTTVIEAVVAHCPVVGVKVYVVVAVLLIGVVHDPVIPLFEVAGKVNVPPLQIGATCVKTGATGVLTVTVMVAVVAH